MSQKTQKKNNKINNNEILIPKELYSWSKSQECLDILEEKKSIDKGNIIIYIRY